MDYYGSLYGFSATSAVLAFSAMVSALIDVIRMRQFYGRYLLMFLAGTFSFVQNITFIAAIAGDSSSASDIINGNLARSFLSSMFNPLLYCVFFEICRTIIIKVQPATTQTPTRSYYARKISYTYAAYLWTVILLATNIAYPALIASDEASGSYDSLNSISNIWYFNTYGVWAYVLFAIGQLISGSRELRPCMMSIIIYFVMVLIVNIGNTVGASISIMGYSQAVLNIISFVMVDLFGLFGLLFALWASPRSWSGQTKPVAVNQPYYGYYGPPTTATGAAFAPQPPQPQTFANAAGSSVQATQQYPVVQIPQQQLQSGQFPVVQIPISLQQQGGQYPVVQVQAVPQQASTGQYAGYQ